MMRLATIAAGAVGMAEAKIFFQESFDDGEAWKSRWTVGSEWKPADQMGEWKHTAGEIGADKGIQTSPDARFHSITAPLSSQITNEGKDLVISYTVRHDQNLDCGGAYLKLMPPGFDAKKFGGDTPYSIMFGPDMCGTSTRKTHVIFTYKGKNLLTKKNVRMESDKASHRYTLIVRPDNTYEVQIDGSKAESGSLYDDWDFLAPKKIKDPSASKPSDWVDEAQIPDPTDVKPAGWDDIPAKIPDPNAKKPEDWDDEEDGEWTAPQIDNPEYKGVWQAKKIPNPAYKGPWIHPEIDNPEFKDDPKVHAVCNPCSHVGFELWQVKAGTIFDDIIVTDSLAEAEAFARDTFEKKKPIEKTKSEEIEAANRRRAEEERANTATASASSGDEEEDDEL